MYWYSQKWGSLLLPDNHGKYVTPEGAVIEIWEDVQGNILTPSLDYISAQERVDVMERVASLPVTLSRSIIQDAIDTHDIVKLL